MPNDTPTPIGEEPTGWGQSIAQTMDNLIADYLDNPNNVNAGVYPNFDPSNTLAHMLSKPGLTANSMFFDRDFALPKGANVNTSQMINDIMDAYTNSGMLMGNAEQYANWGLTEQQAQSWENQINNLDFRQDPDNWSTKVTYTSNPSSTDVNPYGTMGANPHQDMFSVSEKTGAGFGPGVSGTNFGQNMLAVGQNIAHNVLGKGSGTTTLTMGVPMAVPSPAPAPYSGVSDHDPYGKRAAAAATREAAKNRAASSKRAASKGGGRSKSKGRTTAAPASGPHGGGMTSSESARAGGWGTSGRGEFDGGYGDAGMGEGMGGFGGWT